MSGMLGQWEVVVRTPRQKSATNGKSKPVIEEKKKSETIAKPTRKSLYFEISIHTAYALFVFNTPNSTCKRHKIGKLPFLNIFQPQQNFQLYLACQMTRMTKKKVR